MYQTKNLDHKLKIIYSARTKNVLFRSFRIYSKPSTPHNKLKGISEKCRWASKVLPGWNLNEVAVFQDITNTILPHHLWDIALFWAIEIHRLDVQNDIFKEV